MIHYILTGQLVLQNPFYVELKCCLTDIQRGTFNEHRPMKPGVLQGARFGPSDDTADGLLCPDKTGADRLPRNVGLPSVLTTSYRFRQD
ncbi:hypothetical protein QE152_g38243 [Popillia japonica]|uniref:Uncharacterized protein n=1 Tax=Popillia japonica TaxID=7064 RepID=A0AAW1I820_POPJA